MYNAGRRAKVWFGLGPTMPKPRPRLHVQSCPRSNTTKQYNHAKAHIASYQSASVDALAKSWGLQGETTLLPRPPLTAEGEEVQGNRVKVTGACGTIPQENTTATRY